MGDVFEFVIPCHPFNPQIRHLLKLNTATRITINLVMLMGRIVRVACAALDVDLSVEIDGELRSAVRANDWLSIDAESMLLRLNRKSSEHATAAILKRRGDWPSITSYLGIVRDESGRPIARGTVWTPDPELFRNCATVCGGLRTDVSGHFLGIRFGKPETAARHLAVSSEDMAGWVAWAEEQRRLDEPGRFDVSPAPPDADSLVQSTGGPPGRVANRVDCTGNGSDSPVSVRQFRKYADRL